MRNTSRPGNRKGISIRIDKRNKTITTKLMEFLSKEDFEDYRSIHRSLGFRFVKRTKANVLKYNNDDFDKLVNEYINLMRTRFKDKVNVEKIE
jgi:hypothetical protein